MGAKIFCCVLKVYVYNIDRYLRFLGIPFFSSCFKGIAAVLKKLQKHINAFVYFIRHNVSKKEKNRHTKISYTIIVIKYQHKEKSKSQYLQLSSLMMT